MRRPRHALEALEARLHLTADVIFSIDALSNVRPISRFIYGINQSISGNYSNVTFTRSGGNRLTAYNWENNASNAGSDWYFQNDNYLGGGETPGGAIIPTLANAAANNAGALLTIPMAGHVSADKLGNGDVRYNGNTWNGTGWTQGTPNPNYLAQRFNVGAARKGSAFSLTPSLADDFVYQDEFANWVKTNYPHGWSDPNRPIWFALDNEPDLWDSTHAEVHPSPATYAEMVQKTVEYSAALKDAAPGSLIFGPVNYGWQGFVRLQNAPDHNNRDFQEYYLDQLRQASTTAGRRLLDVLDVHWYPEAQGTNGIRITNNDNSAPTVAARVQAPRSLWDTTYTETSWITQWSTMGPIRLIPRLQAKINTYYPGTKLAITEYNYGGGNHISGAIAQADVLGIFGRDGIFAANMWPLAGDESYIAGGFKMFRNYDGANGTFGNTSLGATTSSIANTSVYASYDPANPTVMTVVAINKTAGSLTAGLNLSNAQAGSQASVYRLTSGSPNPQSAGTIAITNPSNFEYVMPAYSVTTLKINLAAPIARSWTGAGDGTRWADPANWAGNSLPTSSDDVYINMSASNPTITVDSGNSTVHSLTSLEHVTITNSASLTVSGHAGIAGALTINGGARFALASGSNAALRVNALSILGVWTTLDLNDNDLVLDYSGAPSPLTTIQSYINIARAGGTWTGGGITSTTARNASPAITTLGAMESSEFKSIYGGGATFSGETIDTTAVLVKYTYYGDADFNGSVDFDDYVRIDAGYNNSLGGWLNGDFDGNGVIDFDDYVLIDAGYNGQGLPL